MGMWITDDYQFKKASFYAVFGGRQYSTLQELQEDLNNNFGRWNYRLKCYKRRPRRNMSNCIIQIPFHPYDIATFNIFKNANGKIFIDVGDTTWNRVKFLVYREED